MNSLLAVIASVALVSFSAGCASETTEGDTSTPTAANAPTTFAAQLPDTAPSAQVEPSADVPGTPVPEVGDAPAAEQDNDDVTLAPAPTPAPVVTPPVVTPAPAPTPAPVVTPAPTVVPAKPANQGPAPTNSCTVSKDALGFFTRNSGKSDYVAYVPKSYSSSKPMRLIVGLHGCSDNATNFAKWAVNPWDLRDAQQHIGISVGGESGNNRCWSMGVDDAKVMAAIEDIAKCFWIDRSKIVIGGYSSGGQLAYRVGLRNAAMFAGILIENSGLWASGDTPANLLAGASWDIPVAHVAHTGDSVFPIAKVRGDWSNIKASGHPLASRELPGPHNGDGADWSTFLIPQSAGWTKPQ